MAIYHASRFDRNIARIAVWEKLVGMVVHRGIKSIWRDCVDLYCGFLGVPDTWLQKCQPEVDFLPVIG